MAWWKGIAVGAQAGLLTGIANRRDTRVRPLGGLPTSPELGPRRRESVMGLLIKIGAGALLLYGAAVLAGLLERSEQHAGNPRQDSR
jgi:hypothetical protein